MTDIPTNHLRQHLAEILRRVAAGESFRVTRRGRVLAVVVPPNLFQRVVSINMTPPVVTPVIVSEFRPPLTDRSVASPEEEFALLEQARRDAIPLGEFGTSAYFRAQDRDRETYRDRYREWLASREPTFHDGGYVDRDGKDVPSKENHE